MLEKICSLVIITTLLVMVVSYGSLNMRSEIAHKRSDNLTYQLTKHVLPKHYRLRISPDINKKTFKGSVKILIHVTTPIISITLHQKDLNITTEKIYLTDRNGFLIRIKHAGVSGTKEQEFYTITLKNRLKVNTYNLHIPEFYGVLNNMNKGFYYAQYIDKNDKVRKFAMTHFEATNARYAFPCFDEPSFKAKFQIYIIRPPNYNSISNTKLIKSTKLNSGLYQDEFETTILMPTYLVAFIVSQMKFSFKSDKKFYRILAPPDAVDRGYEKYALGMAEIILPTLETYFKVNYSLNKMDQAAIPRAYYDSGATANWGLVIYSEHNLLFTPRSDTTRNIEIDTTITHEFVHQWFGNLVTMTWWRYLWLKEGFATFFQNRIMDMIKPEWKLMELFIVITKHNSLETDSSNKTRDMNQDVGTPAEIFNIYDTVAHQKAACVIHMLETIMTSEVFQRGVTNYLQDRSFQSALPIDLYRNFQKAMTNSGIKFPKNVNIKKIMTTWDSQRGYPLIYVERNYGSNHDVVKLTQSRYSYDKKFRSTSTPWFVPINYATESNPNFNETKFDDWLLKSNEKITITDLKPKDWLIINKQEAYYYRVNYDIRNWQLITNALLKNYTKIHILNRVQLMDDSFNFAKTDMLNFEIFLTITTYLYQEDEYITHHAFLRAAKYIMLNILSGSYYVPYIFGTHVTKILKAAYERLGNNVRSKDTTIDKLHRTLILEWMGKLNYGQCRKKAREIFNLWRYNNATIPVDLEKTVLCNTIRNENQTDWDYLFKMYQSVKNNEDFKEIAFQSLGCTEDVPSLQRFLKFSLKMKSNYDFSNAVKILVNEGLRGLEVVMDYLDAHFKSLSDTLGDKYITGILDTIASKLTTQKQIAAFVQLLKKDATVNIEHRLILQEARLRVSANQKRVYQISKYFYHFKSDGNPSFTIPNSFYFILYSLAIIITN